MEVVSNILHYEAVGTGLAANVTKAVCCRGVRAPDDGVRGSVRLSDDVNKVFSIYTPNVFPRWTHPAYNVDCT